MHGFGYELSFKPTGVEWLGDIPEHWEVRRLKSVCRFTYGDSLASDERIDGAIPVFGSNGQVGYHICANTLGSCIIVGRKGSFGKIHYSLEPVFAIDTTFYIDSLNTEENLRFIYYLLEQLHLDSVSNDSAVPGLSREEAYQNIVAVPPKIEQSAIVDYLDNVNLMLRGGVSQKQELVELMDEYKRAVIQQTVTRGLDPDVPLKPSGVEWLGDIPEHWELSRLKQCFGINELTLPEITDPEFVFEYLEINAVGTGKLVGKPTKVKFGTAPSSARRVIKIGDTIVSKVRFNLQAIWFADHIDGDLICSTGFAVLTPGQYILPEYTRYMLMSEYIMSQGVAISTGVHYPTISDSLLGSIFACLPPLAEQATIVAYLDNLTSDIDAAIARTRREIELLEEYRTRLIADVVTGKLDVREAAAELPDIRSDEIQS